MLEPLEQPERAGSRAPGTGLRLPRTRRFVHQMGGDIEVASQLEQGTTVQVHLPLVSSEPPKKRAPSTGANQSAGSCRVLLGEDNSVNARIIGAILRRLGHHVDVSG